MSRRIEIGNRGREKRKEREWHGGMKMMSELEQNGRRRPSVLRMGRKRSGVIKTGSEVRRKSTAVELPTWRKTLQMSIGLQERKKRQDKKGIGRKRRLGHKMRKPELRLQGKLLERRRRFDKHLSHRNGIVTRSMLHNTCKLHGGKLLQ
jgi:hypothetical protein